MKKWFICCILLVTFIFPITAEADSATITSRIDYTPQNQAVDPWGSGTVVVANNYTMRSSEITYSPIFSQSVNFKINWTVPEGVSSRNFIQAIQNNSTLDMGNQTVSLNRTMFTYSGNTVTYTFSKSSFDFWALLRWLASLIFNNELTIQTRLILDAGTLANGFAADQSIGKAVTAGKLPPNPQKRLTFGTSFINRHNAVIGSSSGTLPTWNSYLSPWNAQQAASAENGKADDTQANQSTEVLGVTRVLTGDSYRQRVITLPITQQLNPADYFRSVNLFTKQVAPATMRANPPNIENNFSEQGKYAQLVRTTTYRFDGLQEGTPVTPAELTIRQQTLLGLELASLENLAPQQEIVLTGNVTSEGKNLHYYYRVDQGQVLDVSNQTSEAGSVRLSLPGLPAGKYSLLIGVKNDYGLVKEVTLPLTVLKEERKIKQLSEQLDFGVHAIPKPGDKLYNERPFSLEISDTFIQKSNWKLAVKVETPLQTAEGEQLPADLYLENPKGTSLKLDSQFTPVYTNTKKEASSFTPLNFPSKEGFYLQMNSSNVRTKTPYQGNLQFMIQVGP